MTSSYELIAYSRQAAADARGVNEDIINDTCRKGIRAFKYHDRDKGILLARKVLAHLRDFRKGSPQIAGKLLVDRLGEKVFFRSEAIGRSINADDNASRQIARCGALREILGEFESLHLGADRMMPEKKVQDPVKLAELTDKAMKEGAYIMHTAWEQGDDASKKRIPEPEPGCPKCLGAGDELAEFVAGTGELKPRRVDSMKALNLFNMDRFRKPVSLGGYRDGDKID